MSFDNAAIHVGLNAVVIAAEDAVAKVLAVQREEAYALPAGLFDPKGDRTLNLGLRRWIKDLTGLDVGYVEQLYTFGNQYRDTRELEQQARFLSIGYLGLMREQKITKGAQAEWHDIYDFLPWEDFRSGRPAMLNDYILPALSEWCNATADPEVKGQRHMRVVMVFGRADGGLDLEKPLQRFELMYEAGLLPESHRDYALIKEKSDGIFSFNNKNINTLVDVSHKLGGQPMVMDHRRILASAIERVRGKIKYRPLVFELMPEVFTLLQLQQVVEALSGIVLHKQNFRRLVQAEMLVEETGQVDNSSRGRPAALFRFRPQVLSERPAPGVGLPKK